MSTGSNTPYTLEDIERIALLGGHGVERQCGPLVLDGDWSIYSGVVKIIYRERRAIVLDESGVTVLGRLTEVARRWSGVERSALTRAVDHEYVERSNRDWRRLIRPR